MKRLPALLLLFSLPWWLAPLQASAQSTPVPQFRPGDGSTVASPECSWIGRRIVASLLRDDVLAAEGFMRFYRDFSCPQGHVGRAFGCAVPAIGEDAAKLEARVNMCWDDPSFELKEDEPATPAPEPGKAMPEKAPADGKGEQTQKAPPAAKPATVIKTEPAAPSSTAYPKK